MTTFDLLNGCIKKTTNFKRFLKYSRIFFGLNMFSSSTLKELEIPLDPTKRKSVAPT